MALGFLAPSVLLLFALHTVGGESLPVGVNLRDVAVSGLIWALANLAYILAIDAAGVARATAVKNLTGLFGTLAGIVLLGELIHAASIAMTLVGSAAVAFSAVLLGRLQAPAVTDGDPGSLLRVGSERGSTPGAAAEQRDVPAPVSAAIPGGSARILGMFLALLAAIGLGVYLVPGLSAMGHGVTTEMYVASFAFVAGVASLVIAAVWARIAGTSLRARPREIGLAGLAGVLWIAGSAAVTPATELAGLAIAWPVSQLGFFLTLAYAVVRLREVDWVRGRRSVWAASVLTLIGLVLLGVARRGG
jgi:glucose uptake protein GlcU